MGSIAEADDWLVLDEAVVDSYVSRALALLLPGPRKLSVVRTQRCTVSVAMSSCE